MSSVLAAVFSGLSAHRGKNGVWERQASQDPEGIQCSPVSARGMKEGLLVGYIVVDREQKAVTESLTRSLRQRAEESVCHTFSGIVGR